MGRTGQTADGVVIHRKKLSDYHADPSNANRSTHRGRQLIADSFQKAGAGRSLLADANDVLIAGNHAIEGAAAAGITDVIEVETDGRALVVVKRKDLDLTEDEEARYLAYADNRSGEVSLNWDADQLALDIGEGIDLELMFRGDELDDLMARAAVDQFVEGVLVSDDEPAAAPTERGKRLPRRDMQVNVILMCADVAPFEAALKATGILNRGAALLEVCRAYLEGRVDGENHHSA